MYGITIDEWEAILEANGSCCGICGSVGDLVVDHNHETNEVRGPLCRLCNAALGAFHDNIDQLLAAIAYLRRYE